MFVDLYEHYLLQPLLLNLTFKVTVFKVKYKASVTIMADFSPEFDPPVRWRSKHKTENDC